MKSVLISIKPQWCEKIASGRKTFEVRHTAPKETPFKCYIYCTKSKPFIQKIRFGDIAISHTQISNNLYNGKVIGEFICDKTYPIKAYTSDGGNADLERWKFIETFLPAKKQNKILFWTCLSTDEIFDYIGEEKFGYAWHISNLKIYDKPKELSEFYRPCSYSGICYSCNRFRPNGTPNDKPNDFCDGEITRPPQSYMHVKEI